MAIDGDLLLARLAALPAGASLLGALGAARGVWVVGGAVRDLLLEDAPVPSELDLVVVGDAAAVAAALGQGRGRTHEAFGTHTVELEGGPSVDVAMARAETYARPGALPEVRPAATIEEDLVRRDFTVNAVALGVSADVRGRVAAVPSAEQDLVGRRLRVLHDASFADDPTRLLRLVRYAARLGFEVHPRTEQLARAALAGGAPATAGVARMGRELLLLLREAPEVAIGGLALLTDLDPDAPLDVEPDRLRAALALLPADGRADLLLLAAVLRRHDCLAGMHLRREDAAVVLDAARDPEGLAAAMREAALPSTLARLLRGRSVEAVALAGTFGAEEPARRWLEGLRHVGLQIAGADLLEAGVPQGPEVGRRLATALDRKLDEGLATKADELAAALSAGDP